MVQPHQLESPYCLLLSPETQSLYEEAEKEGTATPYQLKVLKAIRDLKMAEIQMGDVLAEERGKTLMEVFSPPEAHNILWAAKQMQAGKKVARKKPALSIEDAA